MIEVVSAVIVRNNRILLTQRPEGKDFPFSWECPGGKVDGNESHHEALQRELCEELGLNEIGNISQSSVWCGEFDTKNLIRKSRSKIFLLFYRVSLSKTDPLEPSPIEGQGIGWFTANEMRRLSLAPGNQHGLESICKAIEGG